MAPTSSLDVDLIASAPPVAPSEPVTAAAFGLGLRLHFSLPGLPARVLPPTGAIVDVLGVSTTRPLELFSGPEGPPLWQTVFEDGATYCIQPGRAGDHLIHYRGSAAFHLSADCHRLSCAEPPSQDEAWLRNLLDTVLWSVALLCDVQLLHASAVDSPAGVVAIVADQGGGKSSLAAALIAAGWQPFTDDILAFEPRKRAVVVHPGPGLMNLPLRAHVSPTAQELGKVLARFPAAGCEEAWIRLHKPAEGSRPLAAVVLLRRGGSGTADLSNVAATPIDLRLHTLAFGAIAGSERRRFEALSDLIERVPVLSLQAGSQVTAKELARTVQGGLHCSHRR